MHRVKRGNMAEVIKIILFNQNSKCHRLGKALSYKILKFELQNRMVVFHSFFKNTQNRVFEK